MVFSIFYLMFVLFFSRDSVPNGAQDLSSTGKSNTSSLKYREEERKVETGMYMAQVFNIFFVSLRF